MTATLVFILKLAFIKFLAFPTVAKALLSIAAYLLSVRYIGLRLVARPSLEVWKNQERSIKSFLLFPVATIFDDVGKSKEIRLVNGLANEGEELEEAYLVIVAGCWPVKVVWNLLVMTASLLLLGVVYAFYQVNKLVIK